MNRATNARLLSRTLDTAVHRRTLSGVTTAYTHFDDDGNEFTDVLDHNNPNHIWVRLDETDTQTLTQDARAPISVWNYKVRDDKEGIYVKLNYDGNDELEIIGVDNQRMSDAYGELAATFATPRRAGALVNEIVPDRNFEPLRVRPDESGGLVVYIGPGRYEYADRSYYWDASGTLDLEDVPVSSGTKRAVIIGLDPVTELPTLAYGDEVLTTLPGFTLADYNAVINDNIGKVWLCGYERVDGVTSFASLFDLVFLRAYLNPLGTASGASFMPVELTYELTIPDNKQAFVRELYVTSGSLIVNGALYFI
jgi:hypothetical protein